MIAAFFFPEKNCFSIFQLGLQSTWTLFIQYGRLFKTPIIPSFTNCYTALYSKYNTLQQGKLSKNNTNHILESLRNLMTIIKTLLKFTTQELWILNTLITSYLLLVSQLWSAKITYKRHSFPSQDFYFYIINKMLLLVFKNDIKMTQQSSVGENAWEADQKHNELLGCSENSRSLQGNLEKIFCMETILPIYHISPKVLYHLEYLLENRFSVFMVVKSATYNSRHNPAYDIAIGDNRKLPPHLPPNWGQDDRKDTIQQNTYNPNLKHMLMSYGCVSSPNEDVRTERPELPFLPQKALGLSLLLQSEPWSKGSAR